VATTVQLIRLVHETWNLLPQVRQPILVMQSRQDHTVMPINVHWLLNRVGSTEREVLWLNESYHVITEDFDAEHVAERVVSFVRRQSEGA
jgi:carboxylesterase